MAQQSKFSGALSALRHSPEPEAPPATLEPVSKIAAEVPPAPAPVAEAPKGKGRPPGKRSDPEFKPTTLFLRTRTKRTASRLLEDKGDEQDLSELVEQLLSQWNKHNS
jgi:hypothetical protein